MIYSRVVFKIISNNYVAEIIYSMVVIKIILYNGIPQDKDFIVS